MPQTLSDLATKFSIPGLQFASGEGGLTTAIIDTPQVKGKLFLHGAHVSHFEPRGEAPVLWMSESSIYEHHKPIRGGVPICFPWFGPHPQGLADAPAHGLARLSEWEVVATKRDANDNVCILLQTQLDEFELRYRVCFGAALELTLTVTLAPQASAPAAYEVALHTYLAVSDIRQINITGLESVPYMDKVNAAQLKAASGAPIRFAGECDRVYGDTTAACEVEDAGLKRCIRIEKENSNSTVIWNPWIAKSARMADFGDDEWPSMVCVETANVGGHAVRLLPGESQAMTAKVMVKCSHFPR